jgi:hypothetical protein
MTEAADNRGGWIGSPNNKVFGFSTLLRHIRFLLVKFVHSNIMSRFTSTSFVCFAAAVLVLFAVSTAHAASYLHVAFYSDAACNSTILTYVGITSSPRFANQFLDPSYFPIWSPNGCPTDAAPGTILPLYLDNANEIRANVSLNACTVGSGLAPIGSSYRAVCTNSDDSPFFVAATFQQTNYANQSVCETTPSMYSRKIVYASQACSVQGSDSYLYVLTYFFHSSVLILATRCGHFHRYNCFNATYVEVSVCSGSTNCTGCDTSIRDRM